MKSLNTILPLFFILVGQALADCTQGGETYIDTFWIHFACITQAGPFCTQCYAGFTAGFYVVVVGGGGIVLVGFFSLSLFLVFSSSFLKILLQIASIIGCAACFRCCCFANCGKKGTSTTMPQTQQSLPYSQPGYQHLTPYPTEPFHAIQQTTPHLQQRICHNCNSPLPGSDSFCKQCGTRVV